MTKKELLHDILIQFELHSIEGIRKCFSQGLDPNEMGNEYPLLIELVTMYTRSSRFKDCVQVFIEAGLKWEDQLLLSILLNDANTLGNILQKDPALVHKKYTLPCTYTPLLEASLLHICAEFNHTDCAKRLVQYGADLEAAAGRDEKGFGGQTPIFHTVNQNGNNSFDMLQYLLSLGADVKKTVTGITWGKGYDWETLIPAVNPISYAMMGMLPQMHRSEQIIADIISLLLQHGYGIHYTPVNIPNKYLRS
jgi:hypothetical protein